MNSPVRRGVSPAATTTPTGVCTQKIEALFPRARVLGCAIYLVLMFFLPVYLHANMGPPSLQFAALPGPSAATLPTSHCPAASPLHPGCPSPPLLLVWMNVSSLSPWFLDFHTVRFSVSSGCFLFLNLLLSFFWLCEEAQCVYLYLHLGQNLVLYFS